MLFMKIPTVLLRIILVGVCVYYVWFILME